MRKLTPNDIQKIIDRSVTKVMLEKLTVKVGDEYVVQPGLKIRDKVSKLEYKVTSPVKAVDGGWRLDIERVGQDGNVIRTSISQDDAEQYEVV